MKLKQMNPNLQRKVKLSMVNMKTEIMKEIPKKDMNLDLLRKLSLGEMEKKKADTGGKGPIVHTEETETLPETGTEILIDVIKAGERETIIAEGTKIIITAKEAEIPLEAEIIPEVEKNTEEVVIPEEGMTPGEGLITDTERTVPEEEALLLMR